MATILVIEDNEMNRDMLTRRLQRRGYTTSFAETAEHGLEMAKADHPDLVLMDVSLPGMDGWAATQLLKADPATASIPVIALTAHAMSTDRDHAQQVGCDEFETKPIDFATLVVKIEAVLAKAASGRNAG